MEKISSLARMLAGFLAATLCQNETRNKPIYVFHSLRHSDPETISLFHHLKCESLKRSFPLRIGTLITLGVTVEVRRDV